VAEASLPDEGAPETGPPSPPACPPPPPASTGAGGGAPETFANVESPAGLAIDATSLYVASFNPGPISVVPLSGGPVVALDAIGQYRVAMNDTDIFTMTGGGTGGVVVACAKTGCGGAYTTVASAVGQFVDIAATRHFLYTATVQNGPGFAVSLDTGDSVPFAGFAPMFARGDVVVFGYGPYASSWGVGTVSNGSVVTLASGNDGQLASITADCTNAYYSLMDGTVAQVALSGGTPTTIGTVTPVSAWSAAPSITVDATRVYLATARYLPSNQSALQGGSIVAIPIGGGPATTLATLGDTPGGIAVDAHYVYWSDTTANAVMRLAK
jgi:hypothetical protein